MKNKITLITPPDKFENANFNLTLINLNQSQQESVTNWLEQVEIEKDMNIYYFGPNDDAQWLLYAVNQSHLTYCNIDNQCQTMSVLLSWIVAKNKVYFNSENEKTSTILSNITHNRVPDISFFLDHCLFDKLKFYE